MAQPRLPKVHIPAVPHLNQNHSADELAHLELMRRLGVPIEVYMHNQWHRIKTNTVDLRFFGRFHYTRFRIQPS